MNLISRSYLLNRLICIPFLLAAFFVVKTYALEPVEYYSELKKLQHLNSDKNRRFVEQLVSQVNKNNFVKYQAPIYAYIAELKTNKGNWLGGKPYLNSAIVALDKVENDNLLIDTLESISSIFFMRGDYPEAIFYVQKMAEHAFETGNSRGQIAALNRLAKSYIELELFQLAIEPLQKALVLARQTENHDSEFLASRYLIKARINLPDIDPQETLTLLLAAERISSKLNTDDGYLLRLKAVINQQLGNVEVAEQWFKLAQARAESSHDVRLLQMVSKSFSEFYLASNRPVLALDYASKSLAYNKQMAHANNRAAIHYLLSNIYQQMGDDKNSLKYLRDYANFQLLAREKNTVSLITSMDKRIGNIKTQHKHAELKNSLLINKVTAQESEKRQQFFIFIIIALVLFFCFLVMIFIARQRMLRAQMVLSMKDELTGLFCRSYLKSYLPAVQSRFERESDDLSSLGVLIIDCDDFKFINDTFGHAGGDKALKAIVSTISTQIREHDLLLRWGGDEFVLICESVTLIQMRELADRIIRSISDMVIEYDEVLLTVTVSAGYALHDKSENFDFDALIKAADEFLLASKKLGKNNYLGDDFTADNFPNSFAISTI